MNKVVEAGSAGTYWNLRTFEDPFDV